MSDTNNRGSGSNDTVRGDTTTMPDRGTSTGMNGDSYGADLSQDSTNGMGSITGSTKSDPMDECSSDDPTFGPAPGDAAEDKAEGN